MNLFDRSKLLVRPLSVRKNSLELEKVAICPKAPMLPCSEDAADFIACTAERIKAARAAGRPVILAFGAHAIKNGCGTLLIDLLLKDRVTHLCTNGAGVIHDWEFSFQGLSGENVQKHAAEGMFGLWEETGRYINLALVVGAWRGIGYGASIGSLIEDEGLNLPSFERLEAEAANRIDLNHAAAALDLMNVMKQFDLAPGRLAIPHPYKHLSVQGEAFRLGIPFTGHPMFGHDIIYTHPMNCGPAIGRTAHVDFLTYAESVRHLEGGVYLSVGSAVMSPMIFEKSLSMSRNVEHQAGRRIDDFFLGVVDIAPSTWDWQKNGEPPMDNPAYYLRYLKTFSRMGGTMRYASIDNRAFFLGLVKALNR